MIQGSWTWGAAASGRRNRRGSFCRRKSAGTAARSCGRRTAAHGSPGRISRSPSTNSRAVFHQRQEVVRKKARPVPFRGVVRGIPVCALHIVPRVREMSVPRFPFTITVAPPAWSKWRWVRMTSVTSSGATPFHAASRARVYVLSVELVDLPGFVRILVPFPVSTRIVRPLPRAAARGQPWRSGSVHPAGWSVPRGFGNHAEHRPAVQAERPVSTLMHFVRPIFIAPASS